ncbi:hypothetical protein EJP617_01130 [Erwinia sp. Ejp617]|nr:hypothetical protein EJP617_01130 [Erwinia sp. Ejp617]
MKTSGIYPARITRPPSRQKGAWRDREINTLHKITTGPVRDAFLQQSGRESEWQVKQQVAL